MTDANKSFVKDWAIGLLSILIALMTLWAVKLEGELKTVHEDIDEIIVHLKTQQNYIYDLQAEVGIED